MTRRFRPEGLVFGPVIPGQAADELLAAGESIRENGATVGKKDIALGKLAQTQINDVVAFFGYDPCDEPFGCPSSETDIFRELSLVASIKSGGPVALGASIIKNGNGSSVFVAPVKVATP